MSAQAPGRDDPFESAGNAQLAPREFYGQISVDCWYCTFEEDPATGKKAKVPYDEHKHDRRMTSVDIEISPLADSKAKFSYKRSMLDWTKEWAGTVLPSLKAAGMTSLRELDGMWCKVIQVPSGRKYTGKTGDTKDDTMPKFLALYKTEQECREAWMNHSSTGGAEIPDVEDQPVPGFDTVPAASGAPQGPAVNKERETAYEFLKVLAKGAAGNRDALAAQIANMPMISKYFTVDSPEVTELLKAAA